MLTATNFKYCKKRQQIIYSHSIIHLKLHESSRLLYC